MIKNLAANTGDAEDGGSILGLRRTPGGRNDNPLQYSYLENPMNRGDFVLFSIGLQRVGHDWLHTHTHARTPYNQNYTYIGHQ